MDQSSKYDKIDKLKHEVAKDLGVEDKLNQNIYMGDIPSNMVNKIKNSGNVGGEMVKRMIEMAEKNLAQNYKK